MVAYMREATPQLRKAALGVLLSGTTESGNKAVVKRSLFSFAIGGNAGGKKE